ncbi:TDP-N-acetylfucosamine:lipid II N-acetylfucosaminyltransferase [Lachnospiraceae bacterium SGI.085]
MILHIFPYEKFTQDYIERVNNLYDSREHEYWIYGEKEKNEIHTVNGENVVFEDDIKENPYLELRKHILKSDKVIVHSLFFGMKKLLWLTIIELFHPDKFFWNIWGGDLYNEYWNRNESIKAKLRENIKKCFIRNLRAVGYIRGDYEFLKEHYKTKAKFYIASYSYDFFVPQVNAKREDKKTVNILLGNSATKECRYDEMIEQLKEYKDYPINIKCVLSYPTKNEEYRNHVIEHGKSVFGDKFIPLVDFMNYDDYTKMLAGIDVAIFNHNRQQALGNIASLLYLGKRVFINPDNACKSYFEDIGAIIYSTEELTEKEICKKDNTEMKKINQKAIDDFFSDEQFKKRWDKIFKDNY